MRWIVRVVLTLALCLALAVGLLFLVPSERVAALASREFEQATGRALRFTGPIRPVLWPQLGVQAGEVELANAPWSAEGPMMRADGLLVGIDLAPLLGGEVRLGRIVIDRPRLLLERDTTGRTNWQFDGTGEGMFTLAHGAIINGTVTYIDRQTGGRRVFDAVNADFRLPDYQGAARLSVKATSVGQPLSLTAMTESFSAFRQGVSVPVEAELTGDALTAAFRGRVGSVPAAVEGEVAVRLADPLRAAALLGAPPPPAGAPPAVPVALDAAISWTEGRVFALSKAALVLGGNSVTGDAQLDLTGARPRLAATLTAKAFDVDSVLPPGDTGGDGWPMQPIAYDWLLPVDGSVDLAVEHLTLRGAVLGPLETRISLDRGRAVAGFANVELYGGTVAGELVMNGRNGLSVGGDLRASGVALGPLLADTSGFQGLSGTLEGRLAFLGIGNTTAAIMNSLSGEGSFAVTEGGLSGLDLAGATRRLAPLRREAGTPFTRAAGSFALRDGMLHNDDFVMAAATLAATGGGTIGIGPQTWNYRLLPDPREVGLGRLRVPVVITGTWSAPEVRLGVASATEEAVDAERRRLESEEAGEGPTGR